MSDIEKSQPPRPLSTASSQFSFSGGGADDGGGDADEDNSSLQFHNNAPSSTCSSSFNLHRQGSSASQQGGASDSGGGGGGSSAHHQNLLNVVNGTSSILGGISTTPGSIPRTTTISTIAMESNTSATSKCSPTRLVIALLQTPHQALHLKIIELSPNLLKLPDNFVEAEDYVKNHSQVIKNLQSKQSPVEELLRQADSLIATQKPRAEVYAAMADSLGQTWKDLNGILDERRIVLELAYNCHKVIQACIDRMNELHSEYSKFNYIPTVEDTAIQRGQPQDVSASLKKLKEDRADVLKRVSQALDVCQQLLNKITDFNFSIDSRQLFLKRDVDYATKQVHRWLERLHDRRMLLEERLKVKREQFEEMQDYLVYDKEMSELIQELTRLEKQSHEFSLGDSATNADSQRDALETMVRDMKMLQERALLLARRLEQDEQAKGKFYQRSGLKQKIYEILGTVNDLITESIDFELSLVDAKEFFHLAEMANQKLDELAAAAISSTDDAQASSQPQPQRATLSKSEVNTLTYDALSKGQVLLDSLGWDAPRTRASGVRMAYESLAKRKVVIEDELDHLELLDEYNQFLESVNQAYQNILNVETSFLRKPCVLPVDIPSVQEFQHQQDMKMDTLSAKTNFQELLLKLDQIYPNLSEEEKVSTEEKVNQLKSLSNLVVELMLQRSWIAGEWLKVLQVDKAEWEKLTSSSNLHDDMEENRSLAKICDNINALYAPILEHLPEVHRSDPDLDLSKMEARMEEIIRKYQQRQKHLAVASKIRDICQTYKIKLDHHLLGSSVPTAEAARPSLSSSPATTSSSSIVPPTAQQQQQPSFFPVLNDTLVANTLRSEKVASVALDKIIREQLEPKLLNTLTSFFQPLITGFREEILEAQKDSGSGGGSGQVEKSAEELSWERYFERLKESYVRVTKELEGYLEVLKNTCEKVEEQLAKSTGGDSLDTVEKVEKELTELTNFRKTYLPGRMDQDLKQRLDHLLSVVGHEEPPIQAEQEQRTLRTLCATVIQDRLDGGLSQQQDTLTRQLTEKMIHNDLDMINRTLNDLISELEHPCNYGNNLADAQAYLESFERFERTVETLRDKLSRLLTTAGMSETDVKAQNLLGKLNLLVDRKAKRRELILLSLEYFKLIEKSYEHYDQVNKEIEDIIAKSKLPNISASDIEGLLSRLEVLKTKEAEQEERLQEIERISKIIFDVSQEEETRQHYPLRDRSTKTVSDITRVQNDLTLLLNTLKSQVETLAAVPSDIELELESQILVQSSEKRVVTTKTETLPAPPPCQEPAEQKEVVEEIIIPTRVVRKEEPEPIRPKSQEMCTQTSVIEDVDELEAKTREYIKEKESMTMAVLEALRQSMSPIPGALLPPQTVEKETQFEEFDEQPRVPEKVDRDTDTQTISESTRSFETQTDMVEEATPKTVVEISTETDTQLVDIHLVEHQLLMEQQQQQQRRISREYLDPMFVQPLKDLVVNEGDKVVLECKTTGRIQKLAWLKDGLEICNNPDYKTDFLEGSIATLTIDEALPEDSAIFTCRAFGDEAGHVVVETSGRLSIREPVTSLLVPPSFLPHPPSSVGEHGKSHVIQVKVEGNPLPTVQWFKDGECIDTSPDYIITFNNGLCQVMFDELVSPIDDGIYTCVASNKLGETETQVELTVKGDVDSDAKKLYRQPPRIIKPLPKNLMSRAGQRVKLECEWESPTDCSIVWIKDDNKILTKSNSSAEISMDTPTKSTLVFNEAYPVNSGKYSILIRNSGGEAQSDCQIIVKGLLPAETSDSELNVSDDGGAGGKIDIKPCVKMPLKDFRGKLGEPIRLDCVIVGNPEPEVIWYKNGVPLKEGKNLKLYFHGDKCSLVIDRSDLSDNGIYSVSALNNCGEASSKCQVFVVDKTPEEQEDSEPVQPPVFTKMIQDEMVTAGHEFELIVELKENPGVASEVTWWKNNSQIKDSTRIRLCQIRNEYRLHFKEVDLTDKGNYMVKAVNPGGDARCFGCLIVKENFEKAVPEQISSKEIEQSTKLTLQAPQQQPSPPTQLRRGSGSKPALAKAPRFVIPLEGKMVDEGDRDLSLKCKIDASPQATVKWTKNNGVDSLQSGPDMQILYNDRNGEAELKFLVVSVKDGGRYICHASNEHGLATSVSDLIVKKTTFPPVFSKRLQSITVEDGKRIYLEVDVFGKPSPQVQWFLNGTPIKLSEEEGVITKSDSPTRHALVISCGAKEKFAGNYKVIAKNDAGEAESTCVVNIIGRDAAEGFKPPQGELSALSSARIQHLSKMTTSGSTTQQHQEPVKSEVKVLHEDESLVESTTTTTTIITTKEEQLYERVTQVISPVPSPELSSLHVIRQQPKAPETNVPESTASEPKIVPISKPQGLTSQPATLTTTIPQPPKEAVTRIDDQLVPGPEPEILVAPSLPKTWSKSKSQVLQKVKQFEEEGQSGSEGEGPSGGVRIIPISTPGGKTFTPTPTTFQDLGEAPKIEPILPPTISPSPLEGYQLVEPPKISHDAVSSVSQNVYTIGGDTVVQQRFEEQSSSRSAEARYFRPSKFTPERMRESDHESEVETTVIPPTWIPPPHIQMMPQPPMTPFMTNTSAFAFTGPPPNTADPASSTSVTSPGGVKSIAKLWPPQSPTMETQQVKSTTSTMFSSLSTSTPPPTTPVPTLSAQQPVSGSCLSPIGFPPERARSPTPNKDALEMDKLWSRPIRFSSPVTVPQSSIPTSSQSPIPPPPPQSLAQPPSSFSSVTSPTSTLKKKPEVPPKPTSSAWIRRTTPTPYSPVASPLPPPSSMSPMMKPEVPPKPSYLKSSPTPYSPLPSPLPTSRPVSATPAPDAKEPLYYVSTVSTPRTTPVPPQLSGWTSPLPTTPEVIQEQSSSSYSSSFHEKRDFFESSTTSYSNFEESTSTSRPGTLQNFQTPLSEMVHPSGISLLDQSFLPPPGEPPVFMYAPPPPKPTTPALSTKQPVVVSSSSSMQSSSIITSTCSTSSTTTSASKVEVVKTQQLQPKRPAVDIPASYQPVSRQPLQKMAVESARTQPTMKKPTIVVTDQTQDQGQIKTSLLSSLDVSTNIRPIRRPDAPYIRPTKFVPVLDYFSSSSDKEDISGGTIKPKWKPGEEEEHFQQQLTKWRKVTYDVPSGGRGTRSRRRDSLSSLVDKNMQDLNKQFKANISQLSQGLCYNHMERKIQSDLGDQTGSNQGSATDTVVTTTTAGGVEDTNPLIYFKYDFGYEFGIACPRAKSEPPSQQLLELASSSGGGSSRPTSWAEPTSSSKKADDDAPISLPIIHETSKKE